MRISTRRGSGQHAGVSPFEHLEPRTYMSAVLEAAFPGGPGLSAIVFDSPAAVFEGENVGSLRSSGGGLAAVVAVSDTPQSIATGAFSSAIFTVDSYGLPLVLFEKDGQRAFYPVILPAGGPPIDSPGDVTDIDSFVIEQRLNGLVVQQTRFGAVFTTDAGSILVIEDPAATTGRFTAVPLASDGAALDIVANTSVFVTADGRTFIFGTTVLGDLVVHAATQPYGTAFAAASLSEQVRAGGQEFVPVAGSLTAFTTPWGSVHAAYLDDAGNVQVVWWATGMTSWRIDNLSESAGAQALRGSLVSSVTAWGGLNVVGTDDRGRLVALWWSPGLTTWAASPLISGASPVLDDQTLVSYVAPWGGLNVIGLDIHTGQLTAYWWVVGSAVWNAEVFAPLFAPQDFQIVARPSASSAYGGLHSTTDLDGSSDSMTILGRDDGGHMVTLRFGLDTGLTWIYTDLGTL